MYGVLGFVGLYFDVYIPESLIGIGECCLYSIDFTTDGIDDLMGIGPLEVRK